MQKGRVEAFSDGVIAIIITIMVLELKVPHGEDLQALVPLLPIMVSYVLGFAQVGLYWNNHHHMFQAVETVRGGALWANLHWLFWLSLMPFTTGWMGENHFAAVPVAVYGANLTLCAIAYFMLQRVLVRENGSQSMIARASHRDFKALYPLPIYILAIALAFVSPWISIGLYVSVAALWCIPDRRVERLFQ